MSINRDLFKFAFCPDFDNKLANLANLAIDEDWTRNGKENQILRNYIFHTFDRLSYLQNNESDPNNNKWISINSNQNACFNTGLYTKNYNRIFAFFTFRNNNSNSELFKLVGFYDESDYKFTSFSTFPNRASYFNNIDELIFDPTKELRVNLDHILDDEKNKKRIPENYKNNNNLKTLFEGAIAMAKKRISANYNVAVPQFFEDYTQLLIPIALGEDLTHTDLVLAISKHDEIYLGKTCLTTDMAYNNARLIAKPEVPWINKIE